MQKNIKIQSLICFAFNLFMMIMLLSFDNSNADAKAFKHRTDTFALKDRAGVAARNIDDFDSSALENTILGPRIKYPTQASEANSSSQRHFTGGQVNSLPFQSPAEALEIVPGLAVGH